jgi:hypothetical protein
MIERDAKLAQIVGTLDSLRGASGLLHCRKQQAQERGDDGDDNQQFH